MQARAGQAPSPAVPQEAVLLAHDLADAAGRIISQYFRTPFTIEDKLDESPVTLADRQAEMAMRSLIQTTFPEHGIFGEEHGLQLGRGEGAEFMWVLDPIDGTRSFITGKPLFGTLIALLRNGEPILGVIDQPILRERWVGLQGQTTTLNGRPIATRPCADIGSAYMYSTTPLMFTTEATQSAHKRVTDHVRCPMYGCDCYAAGLLAAGFADLMVEADLKPYDYMALVPVIQGAGGKITDWHGHSLRFTPGPDGDVTTGVPGEIVAAGDPRVHGEALHLLGWAQKQ